MTLKIAFLFLMMFSITSFADDKITITGEPVVLEHHDNVYHVPTGYTVTHDYHYVTVDGTNRVCYLEKKPTLETVNVMPINVVVDGSTHEWYCYEYNPQFFAITP